MAVADIEPGARLMAIPPRLILTATASQFAPAIARAAAECDPVVTLSTVDRLILAVSFGKPREMQLLNFGDQS